MADAEAPGAAGQPDGGYVIVEQRGQLGHILLNRPRALNALTLPMVDTVTAALDAWREDDSIATVAISGAGDRGLCAGGDIRALAGGGRDGAQRFLGAEYRMDAMIHAYPKPVVAIMDGIVLGGGVGISAHARIRVATERTRLGMPETAIGFVPDVGGTWLLGRAPGRWGEHLALTGSHVNGDQAVALGFADTLIDSARIGDLLRLLEQRDADAALVEVGAEATPAGREWLDQAWIDEVYSAPTMLDVVARLEERAPGNPVAGEALSRIAAASPTSLVVTLLAVRHARGLTGLVPALSAEYRVGLRLMERPDFAEGVRARLVDKDNAPAWSPSSLSRVDPAEVAGWFADLPEGTPEPFSGAFAGDPRFIAPEDAYDGGTSEVP